MYQYLPLIYIFAGLAIGSITTWLILKYRIVAAHQLGLAESSNEIASLKAQNEILTSDKDAYLLDISNLREQNQNLGNKFAGLQVELSKEKESMQEKLEMLNIAQVQLSDAFKALSSEALKQNNQAFLDLAKTNLETFNNDAKNELEKKEKAISELLKPITESLKGVDTKIEELEKQREGAYQQITEQVKNLHETEDKLRKETSNLVKALQAPQGRGQWGEMQLKRVVEMAGMLEYCDFTVQESHHTDDGRQRPDMIIRLPANKQIIIDAKAPLSAYLESAESQDDIEKEKYLLEHSRQVRQRVAELSKKEYWNQFANAPDFVVMFLPSEVFLTSAMLKDSGLFDDALKNHILITTPVTLIALLKSASYGWQQEALTQNALDIRKLGQELFDRLSKVSEHINKLGRGLKGSVEAYNGMVSSLESRVMVSARKFNDLKAVSEHSKLELLEPIDNTPRLLQSISNNEQD